MDRDPDIVRTDVTAKNTILNDMISEKCCQAYDAYYGGGKPCQAVDGYQDSTFHSRDSHRLQSNQTSAGSSLESTITEKSVAFPSHMARIEWLASLGTLSASVAHELMQPLTVIRLSLDDALDELKAAGLPSKTVVGGLEDALAQVANLTSIIERFRKLTRDVPQEAVGEIDVKNVVKRIVNVLRRSAQRTDIELHVKEMDGLPPIRISEREMEQLLFALIENAIQAAEGKKARRLTISGAANDHAVELCFSDDCGGIEPRHLDRILEPFFTTKVGGQGTGLGLCIVQRIVARAGGTLRVDSEFGKGATFIVNLPRGRDALLK
ncbi:MAG: ATP-binding protein [Sedimentisphaerales bacterium]